MVSVVSWTASRGFETILFFVYPTVLHWSPDLELTLLHPDTFATTPFQISEMPSDNIATSSDPFDVAFQVDESVCLLSRTARPLYQTATEWSLEDTATVNV